MISLKTYWMGRAKTHEKELTDEILANAEVTVSRCNELLNRAGHSDVAEVSSGWRPQGINDSTSHASKTSKHLTAQAIDLPDPDRTLADWCVDNLDILEELGLWMEDPRWTPDWVHLQTAPPKSGRRIYIPSTLPAPDPDYPVTWGVA